MERMQRPIVSIKREPLSRRRIIIIAASIPVIAIAGGAVFYALAPHGRPTTTAQTPPSPIIPALDDLACPRDVAWSPDGTQIGILGYQRDCPQGALGNYAYWPGRVNIYSANSHKLLALIQPDPSIIAALHLQPPADATPSATQVGRDTSAQVITYTHLLWSPDGKALALSFFVNLTAAPASGGSPEYQTIAGLWIATSQGSNPRILSHLVVPGMCGCGAEWDLTTGAYVPDPSGAYHPDATDSWLMTSALGSPALMYTWGPQGTLMGSTPLNAASVSAAPAPGPIGEPDGGSAFTIWQPGTIGYQTSYGDPSANLTHIPGAQTFTTGFLVWSPDGRYVLDALIQSWRLQAPGVPAPTSQALRDFGLDTAPLLPSRDAALTALLQQTPLTAGAIAWSPNGQLLAVAVPPPYTSGPPTADQYRVDIYSSATGKKVGEIMPQLAAREASYSTGTYLRWSPDGSHLLIFDADLGAVTLVGPDQLPKA